MAPRRNYYEVLGVSPDATEQEIRQAFRRLARRYHPDANQSPDAEERFKEINEAYEVLSDPERRARYDRYGHPDGAPPPDFDFAQDLGNTLFDWVFGTGERSRAAVRGRDLRVDLELTLEEAARGVRRTIPITRLDRCAECAGSGAARGTRPERCPQCGGAGQVRRVQNTFLGAIPVTTTCPRCAGEGEIRRQPCPRCGGQGRARHTVDVEVTIPAGVDDQMRIRVPGQGEAPPRGGSRPGDLWVYVHIRPHPRFHRQGRHLVHEIEVSAMRAALGGRVEIPTLDGSVALHLPPGTQSGDQFRLAGYGLPDPTDPRLPPGDLLVVVRVVTPRPQTERQRQLLRELAEAFGEKVEEPTGHADGGGGLFEWVRNIFTGRQPPPEER